ncbi:MAG: spore maturation protein, partial [Clostridia bacterium]|nr:spore maturation protein [Clostridia bacterium]
MVSYVIPLIFLSVLILSAIKKQNAYSVFANGAKDALSLACEIFPFLMTVMVSVSLFRASGIASALSQFCAPVLNLLGIPPQL